MMKGLIIVLLLEVMLTFAFGLRSDSKRASNIKPRITHPLEAESGQFNYQVGLNITLSSVEDHWCSGSLISPEWILTTARCTDGASKVTAYLGSNKKRGGSAITVIEIIIHKDWNVETMANDISILRIPAITLGPNINPVALPPISESYSNYLGEKTIISGWGSINEQRKPNEELRFAYMQVLTNLACTRVYMELDINPSNICAKGSRLTTTCTGDLGNPLVTETSKTLIGLASFGPAVACTVSFSEAFTRITSYRTWIHEITGV